MVGLHADVGALEAALEEGPEVLHAVRVDVVADVLDGVVHELVLVVLGQAAVAAVGVRVEGRAGRNVLADLGVKDGLRGGVDDSGADLAALVLGAALQDAHDDRLAGAARALDLLLALVRVHVLRQPADVGLVGLDLAVDLHALRLEQRAGLHGEADAVEHEPRRLLRDPDGAVDLVGGHAVLAVGDHPDRDEPLVQAERAVLEDRPDLGGELAAGVDRLALPHPAGLDEAHVRGAARRAAHTLGPAKADHRGQRHVGVREVADGVREGEGFVAHGLTLGGVGY